MLEELFRGIHWNNDCSYTGHVHQCQRKPPC